jgi:hypothetical protein
MNVKELERLADKQKAEKIRIYNPDTEDFTVEYSGVPYTIRALEMESYPTHIANHIKKHLANKLLHDRGIKINPDADLEAIKKEIEVEL